MSVYEKLNQVQVNLEAPKNQYNKFGKYEYRSCEDILKGLKDLLKETKSAVTISDTVKQIGDRYYIEATAKFIDIETSEFVEATALAREDESKKGMDLAQVTGSVSSYARKYALNGLFAIDDAKDSDSTNTTNKGTKTENKQSTNKTNSINEAQIKRLYAIAYSKGISNDKVKDQVSTKFKKDISDLTKPEYDAVCAGYEKINK
ncbi:ERF family protein [Metaclostridioides mangenotii]|uniref:ERF family protein n=1 Tax=Metaclostridioides mangenotii TaxID=1540 RepID=UPI0028EE9EF9|nr:ERF family protein [Clostridioides mangenotii]